jgi:hypothetical protein
VEDRAQTVLRLALPRPIRLDIHHQVCPADELRGIHRHPECLDEER